jgi:RNA ligase
MIDFIEFQKIPRLARECIITEKIDGTNGVIYIGEDGEMLAGSRSRWITPTEDNYGFAKWVEAHEAELMKLGPGRHYGEWWGQGIQRNYSLTEKRFSLFNVSRWADDAVRPACCHVVPVLGRDLFDAPALALKALKKLKEEGSVAAPGFMKPEGIIIYHVAGNLLFKKTIEKDEEWKGESKKDFLSRRSSIGRAAAL